MTPQDGDFYSRKIAMSSAVDALGFVGKGGRLEYQIVIQNNISEMICRKVKKNVTVNACEGFIPLPLEPVPIIIPTKTPIIIK